MLNCIEKIWCWKRQQSDVNETEPSGKTVWYAVRGVSDRKLQAELISYSANQLHAIL